MNFTLADLVVRRDGPPGGGPPAIAATPAPEGAIPFERFRAEVLDLYRPPLRAKATFLKMQQMLREVAALLGPHATTADLTPALLGRYVASRPADESPNTRAAMLAYLRAACTHAEERGYLARSPFRGRRAWVKWAPGQTRHHSREEIARVLELLRLDVERHRGWPQWRARRLRALFAVLIFTGLRRNEALFLHAEDVDLDGRMIFIVARRGRKLKTVASAQPVPIPEALVPILADWMAHRLDAPTTADGVPDEVAARPRRPGCPYLFPNITRSNAWTEGSHGQRPLDRLRDAGRRAGVEGVTFLSLRHTFGTHAEHWGLSPLILQRILRHTTTRTQQFYRRNADLDNLRAAARGIDFGPPSAGGPTP